MNPSQIRILTIETGIGRVKGDYSGCGVFNGIHITGCIGGEIGDQDPGASALPEWEPGVLNPERVLAMLKELRDTCTIFARKDSATDELQELCKRRIKMDLTIRVFDQRENLQEVLTLRDAVVQKVQIVESMIEVPAHMREVVYDFTPPYAGAWLRFSYCSPA
ncbi:MAG: hypothetical protein ACRYG5_05490 [Janthinobacterium lividum]